MTWTVSTIVSEIFYCIIGLFFIFNGVKALKDPDRRLRWQPQVRLVRTLQT